MSKWNLDEGFFYGIGVFETIAVEEGKPVFMTEHLRRMERGIHFLHLPVPIETVISGAEDFLKKPEFKHGRKVLKITISEKNIRFDYRENPYRKEQYEKGFSVKINQMKRNETSPLTYYKTINYAENILEKRKAVHQGFDEGIFLNTKNHISEGTSSNVFFVKEGKIYTPPVGAGILDGITRQYLCKTNNVQEKNISIQDLYQCDEMFLTNALLGVMPVICCGDFRFSQRKKADFLLKEYQKYIFEERKAGKAF